METKTYYLIWVLFSLLLLYGCLDQGTEQPAEQQEITPPQEEQEEEQEKIETTTIENITEKPKIILNITEEINESRINYSEYNERYLNAPIVAYFFNAGYDEEEKNGRVVVIKKGDFDLVIDGGVKEKYAETQALLSSIADDIEILVVSSPDKENVENLKKIIDDVGVGEIWYVHDGLEELLEYAKARGIGIRKIKEGDSFEHLGIKITILNPGEENKFDDPENNSPVMLIKDRGIKIMITTNIKDGAMGRILSDYKKEELKADILEMPHYGDRVGQTNTRLFITTVNPSIAIIEGYKPKDIEESSKIAVYNLLHDIYDIETYKTWDYKAVVITYDGKSKGVSFIE